MVPFKLPQKMKALINKKYQRQQKISDITMHRMETVMKDAIDFIISHSFHTGFFHEPSLTAMYPIFEQFYKDIVIEAYYSAKEERDIQAPLKRLSRLPIGLPTDLRSLEKIFRDKRYWPKIMKRSKILVDRLRRIYLRKLKRKFNDLMPQILANDITPQDAKARMMESFQATKSRVELIFRTETTTYFGNVQVRFFEGNEDIIGFLYDAVRDSKTTGICSSRHGLIYRPETQALKEVTGSCHYNCRKHLIPLADTPMNRKMLEDPARDPSKKKLVPFLPGWIPR